MTTSEPCFESGSLSYLTYITSDDLEAACDLNQPTPRPTFTTAPHECVADTDWYKSGSPDKDCDWVASDLSRCDSKEDDAGVLARDGCDATCYECTVSGLSLIHI